MMRAISGCRPAAAISRDTSWADDTLPSCSPDGSVNRVCSSPSSAAIAFMRLMKRFVPHRDARASTRAATLSDATSARCTRSLSVTRSPRRR